MSVDRPATLALVVRKAPYAQRSARTQLDVVLAAATLELPMEVYFLGEGVWQLAAEREPGAAGLPRGLKGWAAIDQMTRVAYFAEAGALQVMRDHNVDTVVAVEGLDQSAIADRWLACRQVMSL